MQQQPIGHAVIGFGGMGGWHARQVRKALSSQFTLAGVFDIRDCQQQAARKEGIHAYESREALLCDPKVELVTVATPNDAHKEIVIAALRHGKHVICEKPVTMELDDLEEMIRTADEAQKLFTVHQNRRWDPDFQTVKEILESNALGRVFNIESRVHGSRGIPGDWRNKKEHGGGMVLDWGIHLLDQMLEMMGSRRLLSLYAQLNYVTNEAVDDGFRVLCNFEGDVAYLVEIGTSNFIELPRWYLLGENGSSIVRDWDRHGETVKVSDWENRDAVPILAGVGLTKTMAPRSKKTIRRYRLPKPNSSWESFYENVYDVIRSGAQPFVTHDQQRRLLRLVNAIFVSGQENRVVELE